MEIRWGILIDNVPWTHPYGVRAFAFVGGCVVFFVRIFLLLLFYCYSYPIVLIRIVPVFIIVFIIILYYSVFLLCSHFLFIVFVVFVYFYYYD